MAGTLVQLRYMLRESAYQAETWIWFYVYVAVYAGIL